MSVSQPSLTVQAVAAAKSRAWLEPLLGLSIGVLGGAVQSKILSAPMSHSILVGGIFGLAFSLFFARRATTPGAGLIWGLGGALLLWFVMPTGIDLLLLRSAPMAMLNDAQARFPQLVAYLVCLGMPVGVVLGIRGGLRTNEGQPQFRWGRAVVAGGLAGTIGGLAFSGWEYAGGYLPLLEGLPDFQSQTKAIILHFLVALLIGSIFGVLFQRDVRGYGSSMGWGLGFGIFLWFLGPLTVFPIVGRQPLDWSAEQGTALFGSLVGYIIYGFILGTIYAFLDRIWVRLFIQSDPLNREPEGLGLHFLRSIEWGGLAGLVGGLVSIPVDGRNRNSAEDCWARQQFRRHQRRSHPPSGKRRNRYDLRPVIPQRGPQHWPRCSLGVSVWCDLVVCGSADSFAVDLDRRVRLEGKRGRCSAPLAYRTLDLRRGHCIYIPPAGAAV